MLSYIGIKFINQIINSIGCDLNNNGVFGLPNTHGLNNLLRSLIV